jgi:trehalose 6-phosphate phosphatase
MTYCLSALPEVDRRLEDARRVLIATDFDGTLCPIAQTPSEVHLAPATIEILRHAVGCQRLTLAVISGRALQDVRCRLPLDVLFAGNHGLEIAGGGLSFVHDGARQLRSSLSNACKALTAVLSQWPSAWIEDKGLSATLHFRKVDHRHHNSLLFAARRAVGALGRVLALRVGRLALEIRPKVRWDKGSALQYIHEKAGPFDACICLGDDRTDESMFRANSSQLNIRVGGLTATAATHYLLDSTEVAIFLSHIVDICGSEGRGLLTSDYAASTAAGASVAAGNWY